MIITSLVLKLKDKLTIKLIDLAFKVYLENLDYFEWGRNYKENSFYDRWHRFISLPLGWRAGIMILYGIQEHYKGYNNNHFTQKIFKKNPSHRLMDIPTWPQI